MRRLSMPLLLIALLSLPVAVCAQVYKWTDAKGTVHFSDSPPAQGVSYKSLKNIDLGDGPAYKAAAGADDAPAENADNGKPERIADTPENRKELCGNLSANIKLLDGEQPLITQGDEGKQQVLSDDRRSQELATAQAQYKQYCQ